MLFVVLWVISPLVFIPLSIWAISKKNKLSEFVLALLRCGRISNGEYAYLRVDTSYFAQGQPQGAPMYRAAVQPQPMVCNNVNVNAQPQYRPYQPQYRPPMNSAPAANNYRPAKRGGINSTAALLIIGVVFVIFAGIIFATAAWLYMSDLERTGVIALASLFFFGVSLLAHRKLKLENTGMAFYMLGATFSAITFAAAGYFRIMGEWFSVNGDGAPLLFSAVFLIVTAFSAAAVRIYKRTAFVHSALYSGLISLTLACVQIADRYSIFVLLMNIITAALIFAIVVGKPALGDMFDRPLKIMTAVSSIVFAVMSLPCLLDLGSKNAYEYALIALFILEAAFYGVTKKDSRLTGLLSALTVILSMNIGSDVTDNSLCGEFIFAICAFVLALTFCFVKPVRTAFSDIALPFSLFVSGLFIMSNSDEQSYGFAALAFLMSAAVTALLAFEDGRAHLIIMRIFAPVPLILAAGEAGVYFEQEFALAAICIVVLTFAAIAFSLNADLGERFSIMHYSCAIGAGIMLIISGAIAENIAEDIFMLAMCAALFAVCTTAKINLTSFVPIFVMYYGAVDLVEHMYADNMNAEVIAICAVFALLGAVSRLTFREKLAKIGGGYFKIDSAAFAMPLASVIILADSGSEYHSFIAMLLLALFALNLYRKGCSATSNRIAFTAASALACLAIYIQPFFDIQDEILRHKFNLIPLMLFSISLRFIWRGEKRAAKEFSFAVNLFTFICLIYDALYFDDIFNTLCVLAASLILLMWSYAMKKKRWFVISLSSLVGITIYAMRDYFALVDWWVYLLLVGILLISIAAANEFFKSRGESVKSKAGKFFDEWKNWD